MLEINLDSENNVKSNGQNDFILKLNSEIFDVFEEKLKLNLNHCMVKKIFCCFV